MHDVTVTLKHLLSMRYLAKQIKLPYLDKKLSKLVGQHCSGMRGRGAEFDEFRLYQTGDDVRSIDWKVTAKTGKTHIRLYKEEKERPVFLVLDQGRSLIFGSKKLKTVAAIETAALIIWKVLSIGDQSGLFIASHYKENTVIKPTLGLKNTLNLLRKLAKLSEDSLQGIHYPESPQYFTQALSQLYQTVTPGSLVILISDFASMRTEAWPYIKLLKQYSTILAIDIFDPLEETLPENCTLYITDGEQFEHISCRDQTYREKYSLSYHRVKKQLENDFHRLAIPYIQLNSVGSISNQLLKAYQHTSKKVSANNRHTGNFSYVGR